MEATKLTPTQQHLLKMFARLKTEEHLHELKKVLSAYYARRVDEESERIWEEKGMTDETIDQLLQAHLRTPYR